MGSPYGASGKIALGGFFESNQKIENHRMSEASWKNLCLRSKWDPEPAGAESRHPAEFHLDPHRNYPWSLSGVEHCLALTSSGSSAVTSLL